MDLNKLISQMTIEEKLGQMFQLVSFGYLSDKKTKETGAEGGLAVTHDEIAALGSVLNFYDAADGTRTHSRFLSITVRMTCFPTHFSNRIYPDLGLFAVRCLRNLCLRPVSVLLRSIPYELQPHKIKT